MTEAEFKRDLALDNKVVVDVNNDDFVVVTALISGYDCHLIRSLDADSDAAETLGRYRAESFTEIVDTAKDIIAERRVEPAPAAQIT